MKNALFAILLLVPAFATAQKQAPNDSDYSVAIHVQSSRLLQQCTDVTNGSSICLWVQRIDVLINEKKYELSGRVNGADLLRVGDYKAKVVKEETKHPYEYLRTYEFLFPDGQSRQYSVTGESE